MFRPRGPTFLELAREGLSSTERGYDLLAPKFDYTPFRTSDEIIDAVGEHLRPSAPFGSALDLCCGTGAGLRILLPLCRERVVGLDFSEGMLTEARRSLACAQRGSEAPSVELARGDALALRYENEFDVVTCFGAFGHIRRREQACFATGVFRALKPGGRFVFVTMRTPRILSPAWILGHGYNALAHLRNALIRPPFVMFYLTFTLEEARQVLEAAGFAVEQRDIHLSRPHPRVLLVEARKPSSS